MCPCPHGFDNENLCNLCHSSQKIESYSPNKDIFPETKEEMKCPDCGEKMTEVYGWIEHPGPQGKMIGHPGPLLGYECKKCKTKTKGGR